MNVSERQGIRLLQDTNTHAYTSTKMAVTTTPTTGTGYIQIKTRNVFGRAHRAHSVISGSLTDIGKPQSFARYAQKPTEEKKTRFAIGDSETIRAQASVGSLCGGKIYSNVSEMNGAQACTHRISHYIRTHHTHYTYTHRNRTMNA